MLYEEIMLLLQFGLYKFLLVIFFVAYIIF